MCCCDGYCSRCRSIKVIVLGAVVMANYYGWGVGKPLNWWLLIGALLVIGGVIKLVMPTCSCNKGTCCEEPAPKGKKRK